MAIKITEKLVRQRIKAILNIYKEYNDIYTQYPITQGFGESGHPDLLMLVNGTLIGIEAKKDMANHHCRPNRKPTKSEAAQKIQAERIRDAGGQWYCIHSGNLGELTCLLEDFVAVGTISEQFSQNHRDELMKLIKV